MSVFIDSDVVISSLLSEKGAAYILLHSTDIKLMISSSSLVEINKAAKRLNINNTNLEDVVQNNLEVIKITKDNKFIKKKYGEYVTDLYDAHIVASAHISKSEYLISYNLKHFKIDKIKNELGIVLLTPALFLQYLRNI